MDEGVVRRWCSTRVANGDWPGIQGSDNLPADNKPRRGAVRRLYAKWRRGWCVGRILGGDGSSRRARGQLFAFRLHFVNAQFWGENDVVGYDWAVYKGEEGAIFFPSFRYLGAGKWCEMQQGEEPTKAWLTGALRLMLAGLLFLPAFSARPLRWSEQEVETTRQAWEEHATVHVIVERTQRRRSHTTTREAKLFFSTQSPRVHQHPILLSVGHRWANGLMAPLRC